MTEANAFGRAQLFSEAALGPAAPRVLSLTERFGIPPFTVFDARQGYWQDRKSDWIALGIESELGRDVAVYGTAGSRFGKNITSQSIFDPVLTECAYRWFCAPGGVVLDPFAGGSVRGVVAGVLGRGYIGIDLSERQISANEAQGVRMAEWIQRPPDWVHGDSREVLAGMPPIGADFLFTCPPYYDLEVYSDDPRDLSAKATYEGFYEAYGDILALAARHHLKQHSFAALVVGNVRDNRGVLRNIVGDTVALMRAAGCDFYNEAIVVTMVGTAAPRAPQFSVGRKLIRTHQTMLVFVKGDPRRAATRAGPLGVRDAAMLDVEGEPHDADGEHPL